MIFTPKTIKVLVVFKIYSTRAQQRGMKKGVGGWECGSSPTNCNNQFKARDETTKNFTLRKISEPLHILLLKGHHLTT